MRGRIVEGLWILGMLDIETNEIHLEICPNNKRDKNILLSLVRKHVRPDSTIFTDCWRGYYDLPSSGFEHYCVNHELHFDDPETKVNTNKIESQCRSVKKRLARGGISKEKLADHLCEFLWRRDAKRQEKDPFMHLITIIAKQFAFS